MHIFGKVILVQILFHNKLHVSCHISPIPALQKQQFSTLLANSYN